MEKRLLNTEELEKKTGLSRTTIWRLRKEGMPTIVLNKKHVKFDIEDVVKWLKENYGEGEGGE